MGFTSPRQGRRVMMSETNSTRAKRGRCIGRPSPHARREPPRNAKVEPG